MNLIVYFNGDFYQSKYLPISYLPIWIMISTPIYIFLLFIIGYVNHFKRVFKRLINIKEKIQIIILICGDLKMKILICSYLSIFY